MKRNPLTMSTVAATPCAEPPTASCTNASMLKVPVAPYENAMPNMISALAIDDSRRYLKAPSLATLAPAPCTMSANAGRESISMPSTSGMNPALSIMTQAPNRQEHSSIPDL